MKIVVMMILAMTLSACSSSPYNYHVEPTPIKKQKTSYKIANVDVNLTLGHGAIAGDDTFADKATLQKQFKQYLEAGLSEKGLLAKNGQDALDVSVIIDYKRTFNSGGKALNKPQVSHRVVIHNDKDKLASFAKSRYTTKYAYFEDIAVSLEISAFSWNQEDEPRDIELISQMIVEDLINAGS